MRKLPSYVDVLATKLKNGLMPRNGVCIQCGHKAWDKTKNLSMQVVILLYYQ